jgi:hypothetical protein
MAAGEAIKTVSSTFRIAASRANDHKPDALSVAMFAQRDRTILCSNTNNPKGKSPVSREK